MIHLPGGPGGPGRQQSAQTLPPPVEPAEDPPEGPAVVPAPPAPSPPERCNIIDQYRHSRVVIEGNTIFFKLNPELRKHESYDSLKLNDQ